MPYFVTVDGRPYGPAAGFKTKATAKWFVGAHGLTGARITKAPLRDNPAFRKVKGGRAVSLKDFTGTVTQKNDGTVLIRGRKR